jgi:hypothetical protein
VRQLNSGYAALPFDKRENSSEWFDVCVTPYTKVLRADTAVGRDCGGFGENGGGSPNGPAAKVYQMPVRGKTIHAGVLAHRGNHDSMRQFQTANSERIE